MTRFFNLLFSNAFYWLLAYLPFQAALNIAPGYDLASGRVLILIFLAVWVFAALKKKKPLVFDAAIAGPLALFLALAALSFFWAANAGWAARKILFLSSVAPVFLLARYYSPSLDEEGVGGGVDKNIKHHLTLPLPSTEGRENAALRSELVRADIKNKNNKLFLAIVWPAAAGALIALGQFASQFFYGLEATMNFWSRYIAPIFWGQSFGGLVASNQSWLVNIGGRTVMRAIGLFPDPHMLAFYLGMVLPLLLAGIFFGAGSKKIYLAVFLLLLVVFFLTFSRGGYFGLICSFALVAIKSWRQIPAPTKKFVVSGAALGLLALFLLNSQILARFASSFDLAEGSNSDRLANWSRSVEIFKTSPVLGVGLGNFAYAVDYTQDYRNSISSHNLYLDILAELGIFGLAAWLLVWLAAAGGFYKLKIQVSPAGSWQKGKINSSVFLLGIYGGLIYFAVHSVFETAMFNPAIFAFFMVYLGIIGKVSINDKIS